MTVPDPAPGDVISSATSYRASLLQAEAVAPRSPEIRLGIVMYGGVSLAIYIYGVAHEFFRAVRGQGIYKLIKELTDSDIVVDVISGTSAGGINGILLAYALCNELHFGSISSLGASTAIFASSCARPTVQSGTRPRSWTVRATINPSWKQLSPRWNPAARSATTRRSW